MNKKYLIAGVLCLLLCVVFVVMLIPRKHDLHIVGGPTDTRDDDKSTAAPNVSTDPTDTTGYDTDDATVDGETTASKEEYVSPVDFVTLKERCEDIYSWFQIPGTDISYPVVQHPTEDEHYLRLNIDGEHDTDGTLFTQHTHNGLDYTDPVTIIYGHRLRSGGMFGRLQEFYSDDETFEKYQELVIYLPDREFHYTVFAAVPYGTDHIMYKYKDFKDKSQIDKFLKEIYATKSLGTKIDRSVEVGEDDNILVLSTCLQGTNKQRYIVLAKLTEIVS